MHILSKQAWWGVGSREVAGHSLHLTVQGPHVALLLLSQTPMYTHHIALSLTRVALHSCMCTCCCWLVYMHLTNAVFIVSTHK